MTKILYYVSTFPTFSENFITRELEALLEFQDLEINILSLQPGKKGSISDELKARTTYFAKSKLARVLDVQVYLFVLTHPFKILRFIKKYGPRFLSFGTAISMLPIVRSFKPDLIHANWITEGALIANMLSDLTGIPFSIQCHAVDIWTSSKENLQQRITDAKFVTTCTAFNKTYISNLIGEALGGKIHTIYHYIDPNIFGGKKTPFNDVPVLYLIGRKVEKKGYAYFLKAAKILKDRGLQFTAKIAGDNGPESEALSKEREDLGLQDIVAFTNEVSFDEHSHNYYESDVYVIPSIKASDGDLDGIPYTMVEAGFAGLPVVSTKVSAIPELIDDGKNGFLVNEKNEVELADKLEVLIRDKELRKRMGEEVHQKVISMYGYDGTIKKLHELFVIL